MKRGELIAQREVFGQTLLELSEIYPEMVVFDADVCASTKAVYFREKYPERFYQMGIAEANMIGVAAGMASTGFIPFVSAFAVFLAKRSLDQIRVSVAHPRLNFKINASYAGLPTGKAGATHSTVEDMAIMRAMPNMTVLNPADPIETRLASLLAMETDGPVYLRTVRCPVPVIFEEGHILELGKALTLHEGRDIAVISTGMMTPMAVFAVERLAQEGIKAHLVHMASIKPIDEDAIIHLSREFGHIVTIENHSVIGGLGGAVAEVVSAKAPCFVTRIGFPDIFLESGENEAIFAKYSMNVDGIIKKIRDIITIGI